MSIDFSIVIPTYNSEKFLSETIESIKIQDRSIKIELIFSDGGSKDSTLKIIEKLYQDNLSKIVLHDQVGMTVALNQGFKMAQGKYLSYLNSDDKLNSNALLSIKKSFEEFLQLFASNSKKYSLTNLLLWCRSLGHGSGYII